jgi:hypothetical protein
LCVLTIQYRLWIESIINFFLGHYVHFCFSVIYVVLVLILLLYLLVNECVKRLGFHPLLWYLPCEGEKLFIQIRFVRKYWLFLTRAHLPKVIFLSISTFKSKSPVMVRTVFKLIIFFYWGTSKAIHYWAIALAHFFKDYPTNKKNRGSELLLIKSQIRNRNIHNVFYNIWSILLDKWAIMWWSFRL